MTSYNLDVESFVAEIRNFPELWDLNCEDYKYRHRRQQAWESIALLFIEDFDQMRDYEKDEVYKKLHGKWRNLRDSFVRQMRKGSIGKSYAYGKYLSFLESVYKPQGTQNGSDAEADTPNQNNSDAEDDKPLRQPKKRRIKNEASWSLEQDVPSIIDNLTRNASGSIKQEETASNIEYVDTCFPEVSCSYQTEDDDKSFFESLLPAVRDFDIDQKLEFRSQIISVIKKIRSYKKHDTHLN